MSMQLTTLAFSRAATYLRSLQSVACTIHPGEHYLHKALASRCASAWVLDRSNNPPRSSASYTTLLSADVFLYWGQAVF